MFLQNNYNIDSFLLDAAVVHTVTGDWMVHQAVWDIFADTSIEQGREAVLALPGAVVMVAPRWAMDPSEAAAEDIVPGSELRLAVNMATDHEMNYSAKE